MFIYIYSNRYVVCVGIRICKFVYMMCYITIYITWYIVSTPKYPRLTIAYLAPKLSGCTAMAVTAPVCDSCSSCLTLWPWEFMGKISYQKWWKLRLTIKKWEIIGMSWGDHGEYVYIYILILYYIISYYIILYCIILYYITLYYIILCYIILYHIILYYIYMCVFTVWNGELMGRS